MSSAANNELESANRQRASIAVVGRVNRGKSSVVATLTENRNVKISHKARTTTETVAYPVRVDGELLFTVYDTPGFEDAAGAIRWVREHANDLPPQQALRAFYDTWLGKADFREECELLKPLLDGAAIFYVVDISTPYRANHQAELLFLSWTGAPIVIVLNQIGEENHLESWREALASTYPVSLRFDPYRAGWPDRRRLLMTITEAAPHLEADIRAVIEALAFERQRRLREAGRIITRMLIAAVTLHRNVVIDELDEVEDHQRSLEREFHEELRRLEASAWQELQRLYLHEGAAAAHSQLRFEDREAGDLFSEKTWEEHGLDPLALMGVTTAAGALTGGVIDAAVGGASFMAGTALGALSGAGAGLYGLKRRYASATSIGQTFKNIVQGQKGGRKIRIGPHPSPNLPFVLLNRAVQQLDAVRNWAHANPEFPGMREEVIGDLNRSMTQEDRRHLHASFQSLRKNYEAPQLQVQRALRQTVTELLERLYRGEAVR